MSRLLIFAVLAGLAAVWVLRGAWRTRRWRRNARRACRRFEQQRPQLESTFLAAASATGKPRGLAWRACELADAEPLLAYDRAAGELIALAPATFAFTAVQGGGMEEVEAVGNLRDGVAVFAWRHGGWETDGRAVFNLTPEGVVERFRDTLTVV